MTFSGSNQLIWVNNAAATVTWVNNVAATVTWIAAGFTRQMQDAGIYGKYLSCTITSTSPSYQLAQMAWQYIKRSEW
jgi:hypothetical protein